MIGTLILMIEYNIAIAKFNGGFTGFGNFIKNSTWMVNQMNTIMTSINTTETLDYIHKTMAIIDAICREGMVNCSDHV